MACLFIAGHMCVYAASYVPYFAKGSFSQTNVFMAIVIAFILLVLLLLLGVTSLRVVKRPWAISWAAVCISYSTNVCLIFLL